jgi:hypothetical protein
MRRDFLKLCSLSGLGLAAPVGLTSSGRAQTGDQGPYEGPYYVVFNASGGWDTTYLMDPKGVEGINRLYQQGDIETHGPHRFAPTAAHIDAGISNENFFAKYGDELLVFNGLDYSVNNHSPCSRYMATGKLDSLAYPTFAALVAACKGPQCPLAFLTFGNYSATGNLVAMARIPYLPTLKLIARADHVEGGSHQYHDDFMSDRIEQALSDQRDAREKTPRLPRAARAQSMLYSAQLNSKSLERVTPHIPSQVPKERLARQAEITLASFKAGICVSANLNIGQFDSHANNDRDQMKLIPEFLAGIDYLVSRAEELGIRDQLVVVIQSEMGRTPNYNKGDGKDHWSIGSIMFLGQGIQGRRVIGETDDGQFLKPIDPQTLGVDPQAGIHVRPEHIHQALREHAGISEHPFSKQFPLDVADKGEELQGFWGG